MLLRNRCSWVTENKSISNHKFWLSIHLPIFLGFGTGIRNLESWMTSLIWIVCSSVILEHFSHQLECLSPMWSLWDCLTQILSSNPPCHFVWDTPCHQISFYHLPQVGASCSLVTQPCYQLGNQLFHYKSKQLVPIKCLDLN